MTQPRPFPRFRCARISSPESSAVRYRVEAWPEGKPGYEPLCSCAEGHTDEPAAWACVLRCLKELAAKRWGRPPKERNG